MGIPHPCSLPLFSLLALVTTEGGLVGIQTVSAGGVTTLSYEPKVPMFVALACIATCIIGWFLSTKRWTRHVGWILMIGGVVVFFLTVPNWLQEKITFDDTQVTRVTSRWFLPHTEKFRWEDVGKIEVTDVTSTQVKKRDKTLVKFIMHDGRLVDWGNISLSPLVGAAFDEVFAAASSRGIPVESKTVADSE